MIALPPNAPKAAVDALRAALTRLNGDQVFAAHASKVLGFVPEYYAGDDANERVRDVLTIRPEVRAFVADDLNRAPK